MLEYSGGDEGGMTVTQSITSEVVVGGYDLLFNELL